MSFIISIMSSTVEVVSETRIRVIEGDLNPETLLGLAEQWAGGWGHSTRIVQGLLDAGGELVEITSYEYNPDVDY